MRKRAKSFIVLPVLAVALLAGCATTPTQEGAVVGGALGAAAGAVIGHQVGKQGEGALIGAGVGALTGALVGDQIDEQSRRSASPRVVSSAAPARPHGHYETRPVRAPSGEIYEGRVWVPNK